MVSQNVLEALECGMQIKIGQIQPLKVKFNGRCKTVSNVDFCNAPPVVSVMAGGFGNPAAASAAAAAAGASAAAPRACWSESRPGPAGAGQGCGVAGASCGNEWPGGGGGDGDDEGVGGRKHAEVQGRAGLTGSEGWDGRREDAGRALRLWGWLDSGLVRVPLGSAKEGGIDGAGGDGGGAGDVGGDWGEGLVTGWAERGGRPRMMVSCRCCADK